MKKLLMQWHTGLHEDAHFQLMWVPENGLAFAETMGIATKNLMHREVKSITQGHTDDQC